MEQFFYFIPKTLGAFIRWIIFRKKKYTDYLADENGNYTIGIITFVLLALFIIWLLKILTKQRIY